MVDTGNGEEEGERGGREKGEGVEGKKGREKGEERKKERGETKELGGKGKEKWRKEEYKNMDEEREEGRRKKE